MSVPRSKTIPVSEWPAEERARWQALTAGTPVTFAAEADPLAAGFFSRRSPYPLEVSIFDIQMIRPRHRCGPNASAPFQGADECCGPDESVATSIAALTRPGPKVFAATAHRRIPDGAVALAHSPLAAPRSRCDEAVW